MAFDAASISGAQVSWGLGGIRLSRFARALLEPGALVPSPFEPNLVRSGEVREALAQVAHTLGTNGRRASLLLPDGLARTTLLESARGVDPVEYARFRLAQGLPYPASEAVIDALPLGGGRFLAAAVRRSVIAAYEAAAAATGFTQERLDLTPLAALTGLLRQGTGPNRIVDVVLGDVALSIAAFEGGLLRVFRSRRRDPGPEEPKRLFEEAQRTAALTGGDGAPRLRIVGNGARRLLGQLAAAGHAAEPGWQLPGEELPVEAVELAWLGSVLG